jgi:Dyp-type peroxidase family
MTTLELDDIQRLILFGLGNRPHSLFTLCRVCDASLAKRWVGAQLSSGRITSASGRDEDSGYRLFLAFTYQGLNHHLGVAGLDAQSFIPEFRQGMTAPSRARTLGDGKHEGWCWADTAIKHRPEVHLLCAAYASKVEELPPWSDNPDALTRQSGLEVVRAVRSSLEETEPFGFRDGLSEPYVEGSGRSTANVHPRDRLPPGEFILGYKNAFRALPASPRVDALRARARGLPSAPLSTALDFGRNGSFLAVRELEQDVTAFKQLPLDERARIVGRWPSGAPLVHRPESPDRSPEQSPLTDNDFTYHSHDAAGLRCPLGAHIRRANPRDALTNPGLGVSPDEAVRLANQHRILRRSRSFSRADQAGLFFMCFNANLERQFEFVQQTWINNPRFAGPRPEIDPLLGGAPQREFTHRPGPERTLSRGLPAFVRVLGGGYFFMPGLRALQYLAES